MITQVTSFVELPCDIYNR